MRFERRVLRLGRTLSAGAALLISVPRGAAAQAGVGPPRCGGASATAAAAREGGGRAPSPTLRRVADVPMPGPPKRFDYQSLDETNGRLYLAHMGAGQVIAFDTRTRRVVGTVGGLPGVTGVRAVPELDRVYASATGLHQVAILEAGTLRVVAKVGHIGFPDGIAYAPRVKKVYVSDESGGGELVIDATHDRALRTIPLGGEAGNSVHDAGSGCVLVAVQTRNEVVAIDPATDRIASRYPVPGVDRPHGMLVDTRHRLLFVTGEGNATLAVMDLRTMRVTGHRRVGDDPDVLAFDPTWRRLYVAAESGRLTMFDERGDSLVPVGSLTMPHAHSVSVSPDMHLVYFPLQDVGGRPVLRIMALSGAP
jgi:DNA-binding beta-propeller fold protein YncE